MADKVKTEAEKSAVNNGRETGRRLLPHERKEKGITMNIIRAKDYQDMSRKAANIISAQIIMKPDCVLGLATGSTPVGTYRQLIEWYEKGDLDFSRVSTVNLDEYRGLTHIDPQSYYYFMQENLFDHVNIDKAATHVPDGTNPDAADACAKHEQIIKSESIYSFWGWGITDISDLMSRVQRSRRRHIWWIWQRVPFGPMHVFLPLLTKCPSRHILWE